MATRVAKSMLRKLAERLRPHHLKPIYHGQSRVMNRLKTLYRSRAI
jgi:replication-associated recombination protein RarA